MHLDRHVYEEHGWGRVRSDVEGMLTCDNDTVHSSTKACSGPGRRRSKIPVPPGSIPGEVHLKVIIWIASATDPEHPPNYSAERPRRRLRPHRGKFTERKDTHGQGWTLEATQDGDVDVFKSGPYISEPELRDDARKWETTLSDFNTIPGESLFDPVIELHHNPASAGRMPCLRNRPPTR